MSGPVRLRTAIGKHRYLDVLRDGTIRSDAVELAIEPFEGTLRRLMTRMVRTGEFDVCEMSPTSYLLARLAGAPLIGLPVFPYRLFPFDKMVVREGSGIESPADLSGARIGVRTWAQPISLWLRMILPAYYGATLDGVVWTFVAEDPVADVQRPAGSVDRLGASLYDLLAEGAIDVVMGSSDVPEGCRTLVPDPGQAARDWYAMTGFVPANHMIVVRKDVAERVDLTAIAGLFERAKVAYLTAGRTDDGDIEHVRRVTGLEDPLPNGWSPNVGMWTALVGAMEQQGMISGPAAPEDLVVAMEIG